eukprot:3062230-Pyramimonas_sp.AAC.1
MMTGLPIPSHEVGLGGLRGRMSFSVLSPLFVAGARGPSTSLARSAVELARGIPPQSDLGRRSRQRAQIQL